MELPCRIGKYELQEFLGGGMSHVYRAVDTIIGRQVAIKILTEQGCADEEARGRFLQEARTAGRVSHENILAVYDFGEDQGKPFMVMEFLRGEDLRNAIRNGHTGDARNKLRLALQIARALEFIHQQRITHRDIKPDNVYINQAGNAKLMDFGIAKSDGAQMTRAGFILGTPYYMAPEQVQGREVTPLVDVYAFGVLLFELFAGIRPIQSDSVERIFYAILHEPLDLSPLERAAAPEEVRALIATCTAKDPAARYQSFTDICAALETIVRGERPAVVSNATRTMAATAPAPAPAPAPDAPQTLPPVHSAPAPRRSAPGWLAPFAVVVTILIVIAAWLALRPGHEPPATHEAAAVTPALPATIATNTGEMLLVPAGAFLFGADKIRETLPAYYVDRTEVSNGAYQKFAAATGHRLPERFLANRPELPVVNVTIEDARQFAAWAGKRIPNVREWEKAARGADGRAYPWGDQPNSAFANVGSNSLVPVDSFPNGRSPYGALQMSGNVWELIDEPVHPSAEAIARSLSSFGRRVSAAEPWVMIRGGAFDLDISKAVIYDGASIPATYHSGSIGFRCVRNASQATGSR